MSKLLAKAHIWAMNKRYELAEAREERGEEGQTLIEYVLIIGVVVVLLWGAIMLTGLRTEITNAINALVGIFQTT